MMSRLLRGILVAGLAGAMFWTAGATPARARDNGHHYGWTSNRGRHLGWYRNGRGWRAHRHRRHRIYYLHRRYGQYHRYYGDDPRSTWRDRSGHTSWHIWNGR